jgi:tetratricopeptide (TPR) repeat protein
MTDFAVAHLDDIEEIDDGRIPWRPVRLHFGIGSFGVNAWSVGGAGDRIINEHDEVDPNGAQEELYFVQRGRARFELDGEAIDAPAGTFVYVRPEVTRTAFAEEPGTTVLSVGGTPGQPYASVGWELWAPARRLYEAGRYDEAADLALEIVNAQPDYPLVLYNLACCESLAGRKDDAIAHLRQGAERWETFRDYVREYAPADSDFDPIRTEPEFEELVRSHG